MEKREQDLLHGSKTFIVKRNELLSLMQAPENNTVKKINHYARGMTLKSVTSDGAHLCVLAVGRHSSEVTSQLWRAVGDTVFDLTDAWFESQTSRADRYVLTAKLYDTTIIDLNYAHFDAFVEYLNGKLLQIDMLIVEVPFCLDLFCPLFPAKFAKVF